MTSDRAVTGLPVDITIRLRKLDQPQGAWPVSPEGIPLAREAADEITKLRHDCKIWARDYDAATATLADVRVANRELRSNLNHAEKTIDTLESNARVQAKLLADTGRERDALLGCLGECQRLLAILTNPESNQFIGSGQFYFWARAAEVNARAALASHATPERSGEE